MGLLEFYEYVRSDRWQRSGSEKFKELISYAKNLGFETILDVVPSIFDELEISYDDLTFFSELELMGFDWIQVLMEIKKPC